MKKIKSSNIILCILLTIIIYIIFNTNKTIENVNFSVSLWKDNLFPTLFPFMIISNLLIDYGFINIIGKLFKNIMNKVFYLSKETSFVFIISLFSGFPQGAKYTKELLDKNYITLEEANHLITFTHFSNPIFIIGFIGSAILNKKIAVIILLSHYLSGIIVGIIFRNKNNLKEKEIFKENIKQNIGSSLKKSINDSLNTLFLLLGIITIFSIISSIIISFIKINNTNKTIIIGILEMTQGIKSISILNISILLKTILVTFFISFGGLSVHMQVFSLINENKIKYKYFLLARIIHSILAVILVSILYLICF